MCHLNFAVGLQIFKVDHICQSLIIYQQHPFHYYIRLFLVYLFSFTVKFLRTSIRLLIVTCFSLSSSFNKEIVLQSVPVGWWHLLSFFVRLFVTRLWINANTFLRMVSGNTLEALINYFIQGFNFSTNDW